MLRWVLPVFLLAASAGAILQWREQPVAANIALPATNLSCGDIYKIAYWSRDHFGGGSNLDPKSEEWANRTLRLFLAKLDPYKILFTQAEAESFRAEGLKQWPGLVTNQKCDFFESWAQSHLAPARARFEKALATLASSSDFLKSWPKQGPVETADPHFKKFADYAKDEADLASRVKGAASQVAASASPALVAAYDNDKAKLVRDTLQQGLFAEVTPMRVLLAKAFLGALDAYSTYFSSSEFEEFYHDLAGGTSGIGIKVRPVPRGLLIDKVISDSPAAASKKVHAGDVIVGIDRQSLAGLPATTARTLLKGGEHTKVALKLQPAAGGAVKTVVVQRERFSFDDGKITSHFLPGTKVGVIVVPSFYGRSGRVLRETERSSAEDFRAELNKLLNPKKPNQPKAESLVIDLRGNPGGFLEEAVSMAGLFIGDQPVVAVVENHHERILKEPAAKPLYQGPLVVLVDGDSASASEVLAGALKDYGRAVVVGAKHTYGKGCVQRLFHLDDEILDLEMGVPRDRGVVKLTTSIYYSPKGHSPADGGVKADIVLAEKPAVADADDEEAAKALPMPPVPEHGPAIGDLTLSELRKGEPAHRAEVDFLAQRHQLRSQDLKASVEASVQSDLKAFTDEKSDGELAEAITIASDLAKYETNPQPTVSRK